MKSNPYSIKLGKWKLDPYRILLVYGITHPAHQHAIKKLLRAGRSHKGFEQDIKEAIASLNRLLEMREEEKTFGIQGGGEA